MFGQKTRSWAKLDTIEEYVKRRLGEGSIQMVATRQKRTIKDTIDFFTNECRDNRLQDVTKDRHAWSFRNGIFLGRLDDCRFIAYDSEEFRDIPQSLVTAKYFDYEYDAKYETVDWRDIPTPEFDTILEYQQLDESTREWMYAMGGRLTFDVNEADGWDVMLFIKGIARSGKSTIITNGFKHFYDASDVKTISNKIEPVFGLSALVGGSLCIAPEVKSNYSFPQAEFQSMVSGEDVSLAQKHGKPICLKWKEPMVKAGNEVPGWVDAAGSIIRRMATVAFRRQVQNADAGLGGRLKSEVPLLLVKCVRAYIEFAKKYKSVGNIWEVLPKQIVDVRKEIEESCSYLDRFLNSERVVIGDGHAVPACVFSDTYFAYLKSTCGQRNPPKGGLTVDYTAGPFQKQGIVREQRSGEYQFGGEAAKLYEGDWYINVNIKHDLY
jgi:phage/plasmid-associated DNA primase